MRNISKMNAGLTRRAKIASLVLVVCLLVVSRPVAAESTISEIVNRGTKTVRFSVRRDGAQPRNYSLKPGKKVQLSASGNARVHFPSSTSKRGEPLTANSIYGVTSNGRGSPKLARTGTRKKTSRRRSIPPVNPTKKGLQDGPAVVRVPVLIVVDDEEPNKDAAWKRKFRKRIEAASDILEKQFKLRLVVVGYARWDSDDRQNDFVRAMREFEQEIDPGRAHVAIGFTSQYKITQGRTHLGGTRGPLHSHILIREWSHKISENERLEVLLHEVGHYLGAVHSPQPNSVMRPVLGDRRARLKSFEITFDPDNAKNILLMANEMRARRISRLSDVSPGTMAKLQKQYRIMASISSDDLSAKRYLSLLDQAKRNRTQLKKSLPKQRLPKKPSQKK